MLNFVVHLGSGRGRGKKVLKKLISYCCDNNLDYTVHITGSQGHATRITKALCENGSSTIIAVGGDGTFHEVLNGVTKPEQTTVGFIPAGRGNDFAKGAGIEPDPIKNLTKIIQNKVRHIDYLDVGGRRCLNIAGTGLDIDVLKRVEGRPGKLTYLKSLLYCLFHFTPYDIYFEKDGEKQHYSCIIIGACNGKQLGGGLKLSPLSDPCDGLINIVIIQMPADGKLLKVLPKFKKGKHIDMPITTHFTCEAISIKGDKPFPVQLDGEIYEDLDFDVKIIKGGLKTIDYN